MKKKAGLHAPVYRSKEDLSHETKDGIISLQQNQVVSLLKQTYCPSQKTLLFVSHPAKDPRFGATRCPTLFYLTAGHLFSFKAAGICALSGKENIKMFSAVCGRF